MLRSAQIGEIVLYNMLVQSWFIYLIYAYMVFQLPLHLYVLNDLEYKLESLDSQSRKQCPWTTVSNSPKLPSVLGSLTFRQLLENLHSVFPSLRTHLDIAAKLLSQGIYEVYGHHQQTHSTRAASKWLPHFLCVSL